MLNNSSIFKIVLLFLLIFLDTTTTVCTNDTRGQSISDDHIITMYTSVNILNLNKPNHIIITVCKPGVWSSGRLPPHKVRVIDCLLVIVARGKRF